ncbi:1628_t:CDS:2, partial [Funneliformis geosporum]
IYANTEDFLMVSTLTNGKTLEDSMGKFPSPLGPKLISLLETLGYPTKKLPENNFKQSNTEDILTKTTYAVTEIETVSKSVVTVIEIVTGPPPQQTIPPTNDNPSQNNNDNDIDNFGQDIFGSSSLNIQNNLALMIIALVCCILGILNTL